jgi:hypothetical protein
VLLFRIKNTNNEEYDRYEKGISVKRFIITFKNCVETMSGQGADHYSLMRYGLIAAA